MKEYNLVIKEEANQEIIAAVIAVLFFTGVIQGILDIILIVVVGIF